MMIIMITNLIIHTSSIHWPSESLGPIDDSRKSFIAQLYRVQRHHLMQMSIGYDRLGSRLYINHALRVYCDNRDFVAHAQLHKVLPLASIAELGLRITATTWGRFYFYSAKLRSIATQRCKQCNLLYWNFYPALPLILIITFSIKSALFSSFTHSIWLQYDAYKFLQTVHS